MNKRGQADQVIASVITFFVVAVLAMLFVNLSAGAGTIANFFKLGGQAEINFGLANDLLSEKITLNVSGNLKGVFVLEAYTNYISGGKLFGVVENHEMRKALLDLLESGECIVLSGLESEGEVTKMQFAQINNIFLIKDKPDDYGGPTSPARYLEAGLLDNVKVSLADRSFEIDYYKGACLK